tara:strand:- start:88 stop:255 length:168 start_codon:yes stop_codon:yes gene_type:complete
MSLINNKKKVTHMRNLFYVAILALSGCLNVPFIPMVDAVDGEYSSNPIASPQQES